MDSLVAASQGDWSAFYRVAGLCSFLSAVSTLLLIFLPDAFTPVADGLPGRMQRVIDPVYQVYSWVYLAHPFLVFTAALGVAGACRNFSRPLVAGAVLGFGLWAVTEAAQQTLTLFAFDDWRRAWLAGDAAVRSTIDVRVAIYDGIWDSAYALLLIGFILGNAFLAALLMKLRDRFSTVIAAFLAAVSVLSLAFLSGEVGATSLPPWLGEWAYPILQPLGRTLIGAWLLSVAGRTKRSENLIRGRGASIDG